MKRNISTLFTAAIITVTALSIVSCDSHKFNVKGQIANAADSLLFFENTGLEGIQTIDSVRLSTDGTFSFSSTAPEAPEFYRLRIDDQIINISIDSTETVNVTAEYPQMATHYEVSGSENCQKIKELALKQIHLQQQVFNLERQQGLTPTVVRDSILSLMNTYKEDVKLNYIFKEPYKAYAYFALFQTIGRFLIFDPYTVKEDIKVFAAVATSWDTYFPGALRGQNLHNIAIEGMKNVRISETKNQEQAIDASKIIESGVIDFSLPDNNGHECHLTDLKGKVVLLDFHLFSLDDSPQRILMLRELYNKYHAQGFEIYQVALDPDEHFWKQATAALPWINVRDEEGISSPRLRLYNVQAIPEFFLIDRGNNLVKRSQQMKDVDAEIKKLL
jgi:peroxiredoxin